MKKVVTTLVVLGVVTISSFGQSKTIESFQDKFKGDRDAKAISISGGLFSLLSSIASWDEDDEDAQVISRIADNIKSMDILSIPLYKTGFSETDIDKMRDDLNREEYEELMTVKEGQDRVYFLTQGDKNTIRNMLVLIREKDEFAVLNINGSLDMKDLAYLAKNHKNWH